MPDKISDFDEKLNIVKKNYLNSLQDKFHSLKAIKELLKEKECAIIEANLDQLNEVYVHVHKIAGSSAMFGFKGLSVAANKLELLLKDFIKACPLVDQKEVQENFDLLLSEIEKTILFNKS